VRVGHTIRGRAAEPAPALAAIHVDAEALPEDPTLRSVRARALLAAFDRLRVSTIHAFCKRLLGEHPLEAGVHPRFEVDADGRARAKAARATMDAWLADPARAQDDDFLALAEADVSASALEGMLDALLAATVEPSEFAADPLAAPRIAALRARAQAAFAAFLEAESGRLSGMRAGGTGRKVAEAAAASLAARPDGAAGLGAWLDALAECWPKNLCDRLDEFAEGRFRAKREQAELAGHEAEFAAAAAALAPVLHHLLALDPARLALVHRVLVPLYADAERRMRSAGAVSFDGLLRKAARLLERHPDLTARMRAKIDQLLVDEFQDTDASQCAPVARLALDAAPAPGLFVVGDPKQSIYGWRNADLAAYEDFRDRILAAGGSVHRLCVNYRSAPAVLDEVERVIAPVMTETPRAQPPFEPLLSGATLDRMGPDPVVEHWIASDWDELACEAESRAARTTRPEATAREARWLASDLLRVKQEQGPAFRWMQVGILLRTTGDVDVYLDELRRAGIPYTVARDRQYGRRREVVEARALLRTLLDPNDQIALVATLRSAWVGVPDAAWRPLWQRGFPDILRATLEGVDGAGEALAALVMAAVADLRADEQSVPGLAALTGWDRSLLHAVDVLAELRRSLYSEPAEQFVERVRTFSLLEAGDAARALGAWRLANLERFFRELGDAFQEARGDTASVLRRLRRGEEVRSPDEEGRPAHPSEDAVQVMTIHGAKGLQFEHVYLLQLHKGESHRAGEDGLRRGEGALAGEWSLAAARVATLGFDAVRTARDRIEKLERVRTLYVAMTRAQRRLVLSGHWSGTRGDGVHGGLLHLSRGAARAEAVAVGLRRGASWDGVVDTKGLRWVFLDRCARSAEMSVPSVARGRLDVEVVRRESEALRAERARAALRMRRALTAAATAGPAARRDGFHGTSIDAAAVRGEPPMSSARDVALAPAIGSAFHALLERMDWESSTLEAEWAEACAGVRAALAHEVAPSVEQVACARFEALARTFRDGPFWDRLLAIGPDLVGRELPVLIEPITDGDGPVGAGIGAIDLLYREPGGEYVIVDFKTDTIREADALAARQDRYREQARAYQRAVQRALGLDAAPRCELWFVRAGERIVLES
jgi:ATP-dependent helicase/nuclease subunit A